MPELCFRCQDDVSSGTQTNDLPLVGQLEERVCGAATWERCSLGELPSAGYATSQALTGARRPVGGTVPRADTVTAGSSDPRLRVPTNIGRFVWSLPQPLPHTPSLATLSIRVICPPRTERLSVYSTADAALKRVISHHADVDLQLLSDTQAYLRSRARKMVPASPLCEAWQEFYRAFHPLIRRAVGACGIPQAEREDCVQEIWVAIVSKLPSLDPDPRRGSFRCWLSTLIHRHVVNVIRRVIRERPGNMGDRMFTLRAEDGDPAKAYAEWEVRQLVRGALDELQQRVSPTNFRIVHLRLIEDHGISEVATRLGLSSGQVRNRLYRANRKLRCLLKSPRRDNLCKYRFTPCDSEGALATEESAQPTRDPSVARAPSG